MVPNRGPVYSGLTRRALVLAAPSLLVPTAVLAAVAATPRAAKGPFYPVRLPSDDDADLVRVEGAVREAGGDILHLAGRLMDTAARPLADARVEIWQCDANGVYLHPGDRRLSSRDTGFQGFGHATTDIAGRFAFRTIVPVPYTGRTPHIHVKVRVEGKARLTTQLFIKGHRQNAIDFLFHSLSSKQRRRLEMVLKPRREPSRKAFETEIDLVLAG